MQGSISNIVTLKSMKNRKGLGRKRFAKERKEKETAAVASMDQNQESTGPPLSAFKHKQKKFRSLKKADKTLPNSPHKRNEMVKILAKKYDIHIQVQESTLKRRKPTSLTEEEVQWILSIYLVLCGTMHKKYMSFH